MAVTTSRGSALGSFYADLFVSCFPDDRKGNAAHFPTLVIEILFEHENGEFTKKRDAYMGSAQIREYVIIDSTRRDNTPSVTNGVSETSS